MNKPVHVVALFAAILFALGGCENEGPMEKAGEKIDEAVEEAGEAVEEAADKVRDATD